MSSYFKISINYSDNDAFHPSAHHEIARILRDIANKVDDGNFNSDGHNLFDINGNRVGKAYTTRFKQ